MLYNLDCLVIVICMKRSKRVLSIVLLSLIIESVCYVVLSDFFNQNNIEHRLISVSNYAVYYGDFDVNLTKFDLVITSPLYLSEEVALLKNSSIVVAYLSLTTISGWEPWAENVSEDLIIGYDPDWDEYIINVSDPRWEKIVLNVVEWFLSKGYSGVFLDNVDMVEDYPSLNWSVIEIMGKIRKTYRGAIIVQNRGFAVLNITSKYIDLLLFEDFGSLYDFEQGTYRKFNEEEMRWLRKTALWIKQLSDKYKFKVLALGYANMSNLEQLSEIEEYTNQLASEYDFIPYVADLYLDKLNMDYAH